MKEITKEMAISWDDVMAENKEEPLQDGEITAVLFSEKAPCGISKARRILAKLVKDGKATRRPLIENGKASWAYRLV